MRVSRRTGTADCAGFVMEICGAVPPIIGTDVITYTFEPGGRPFGVRRNACVMFPASPCSSL